jgi:hypothetical protein
MEPLVISDGSYIAVLCKKPEPADTYELLVSRLIGPYVHTASAGCVLPIQNTFDMDKNRLLFYAMSNQPFSCRLIKDTSLDVSYDVVLLSVHTAVLQSYREVVLEWVKKKIPYNSQDTLLCLTHGGGLFTNIMFEDFTPDDPPSVFCSQAVVLALRISLQKNVHLLCTEELEMLGKLQCNSRATDPSLLFEILHEYGTVCNAKTFRELFWVY